MTLKVIEGGKTEARRDGFSQPDGEWEKMLARNKDGQIVKTVENIAIILTHHSAWRDKLWYDEFNQAVMMSEPPVGVHEVRPIDEFDEPHIQRWIDRKMGREFSGNAIISALKSVAHERRRHPVREYLDSLVWDGNTRVEQLFTTGFGAEDDPEGYHRGVGRRWLVAAVARIFEPGCKADCLPVIEGPQGARKSSGLRALFSSAWFNDSDIQLSNKDAYGALHGKWCVEFQELSSFSRADIRAIKAFFSGQTDHFRGAYKEFFKTHARQCVFAATTNESEWQKDGTGGRRFWPVACGKVRVEWIAEFRDQLWAESVHMYRTGSHWWTDTDEFRALAERHQEDREVVDPWVEAVRTHVMNNRDKGYTTYEILTNALNIPADRQGNPEQQRAAQVLRKLGYTSRLRRTIPGTEIRPWVYFHKDSPRIGSV